MSLAHFIINFNVLSKDDNVKVEGDDGTYANIREKKSKGLFEVKGYNIIL